MPIPRPISVAWGTEMLISLSQSRLTHGAAVESVLYILELFFPMILASSVGSTVHYHQANSVPGNTAVILYLHCLVIFSGSPLLPIFSSCYIQTACFNTPRLELTTCSGSWLVPLRVEKISRLHILGTSAGKCWFINEVQILFSDSS